MPEQGVVVEGVKEVKYAPIPPVMYENGKKRAVSPNMPFFAPKYLTRYTPETFSEEYINKKIFLLLKELWSYTCSKFRKSYLPPAALSRVNIASAGNKYFALFRLATNFLVRMICLEQLIFLKIFFDLKRR